MEECVEPRAGMEREEFQDLSKEEFLRLLRQLPTDWVDIGPDFLVRFGFQLKLAGVDWREITDVAVIMTFFEEKKVIVRDVLRMRRNPELVL